MRLAFGELLESNQRQHVLHASLNLRPGQTLFDQPVGDIFLNGHVRKHGVRLEHHVDWPLVRRDGGEVRAVDQDASRGGPLESRQHAQQGGLAATGTAQDGEEFALVDVEADIINGPESVKVLGDPLDSNERRGRRVQPGGFLHRLGDGRLRHKRRRAFVKVLILFASRRASAAVPLWERTPEWP